MEIITVSASLNTPISFFRPLKFTPVFPPTAASTALSSVVGMLMKRMPRLNVAAAKPPRSVTTPPPMLTSRDLRVAPPFCSAFQTACALSRFLLMSPAGMTIFCHSEWRRKEARLSRSTFSSVRTNTLRGDSCSTALFKASPTEFVKITF